MLVKRLSINKFNEQEGFVSLIVAALIMVILSLITIGFTKAMQREQRQTLDRVLSRQAIYAAESGINDVYTALKNNPSLPAEKTNCDVENNIGIYPNPAVNKGVMSDGGTVAYTCVLYDKTPTELNFEIGTDDTKVTLLKTESGNNFASMKLSWAQADGNNNISSLPDCSVANQFPSSRNNATPLIRLDLTDISVLQRDNLINNTDYLYLAPCQSGSSGTSVINFSATKGQVVNVPCEESLLLPCVVTINSLASNSYSARIRSIYDSAKLVITANDSSNNVVEFKQSQTSIDVTAKSFDVVRRLRVAVPIAEADNPPIGGFQSFDGVCKLLTVDPTNASNQVDDQCN